MEPGVKELFLRSDNAGCYHNTALLSSAAVIIARQGHVTSFRAPDTAKGTLKKPASRLRNPPSAKDVRERNCEETASALFSCPEEGCTKVYRSNHYLVNHLDFGKHQYKLHRETQYDHIRRQWAAKCSSLKAKIPETHKTSSASTASSSNRVPRGWALKARK